MSWKQQWPERTPRPKVQSLSAEEREQLLKVFNKEIEISPVLSSLGIFVRTLRGRFYFAQERRVPDKQPDVKVIGRVTPLEGAERELLLEVERQSGIWYPVVQGTAKEIMDKITQDMQGTFHGLGDLDRSLRQMGYGLKYREVQMEEGFQFVYADTGNKCSFHEALYHYFHIPIRVIAEPRQWYQYHRKPRIIEVSRDQRCVLVEFTASSISGTFSGVCLYVMAESGWDVFTIKPNQSKDIDTAVEWLKKREWQEWQ